MGTEKQRLAGLRANADIYVINRENVVWLVDTLCGRWPFPIVVIDELSSFKSSKSKRFRALRLNDTPFLAGHSSKISVYSPTICGAA